MGKKVLFLLSLSLLWGLPANAFESIQLKKTVSAPVVGSQAGAPYAIAIDSLGRLWVTDSGHHQLHLLSPEGELVRTIGRKGKALGEFSSPRGIAVSPDGVIYVVDKGNTRIQYFSQDGKVQGAFGQKGSDPGQFKDPETIAISQDGVVIVGDADSPRLQLFSKDGIYLHAFEVGTPPQGLAVDGSGQIYVSHEKTKQIDVWSPSGKALYVLQGSEPGVGGFKNPTHLAVSAAGLLYVVDPSAYHFREIDTHGHTTGTFGRSGKAEGQFRSMEGIAVAFDTVYVCDAKLKRISIFALSQRDVLPPVTPVPVARLQVQRQGGLAITVDRLAWNPDGTLHTISLERNQLMTHELASETTTTIDLRKALKISHPSGITTAPSSGNIFISDSGRDRVVKLDRQGKSMLEFGQKELSKPQGLACAPQGTLFVADAGNARFAAFNHQGLFQFYGGQKGPGAGQVKTPVAIAWDKDRVYVADPGNKKVAVFSTSGRFMLDIGQSGPEILEEPRQVAVDREGNLFVLDVARSRVVAYDPQGTFLGGFGAPGKAIGFLWNPRDFALSENGDLFVAEEGRVQGFRVVLLPPAPTGLSALTGEGYVTLRWEAAKTRYPAKYIVYRSTPQSALEKIKETIDTAMTDDTLTPQTTYTYMVAAQSVQGAQSVLSAPVLAAAKPISSGPRIEILQIEIDDVFSSHYKYYSRVPLGRVKIRNNSPVPIPKSKVSFMIQGYMDYPTEVELPEMRLLDEKIIPLNATFNNRILEVTETTPIQAQIKVSYYAVDQEQSVTRNVPFKLYSRNTIRWDNKGRVASFITPNDPPIVDFARAVAVPFIESHRGSPVPVNISVAWALFHGFGAYGITYVPRPNNPYDRVSLDSSTVDSMQFARETLSRKSGDCADVVALLASALESMTITTCALDAPGHLFLMFDTGETQKNAVGFPESMLVFYAGSYWIPIEVTMLGSPFMEAWKKGAEQYRQLSAQGKLRVMDTHVAWRTFEPATLPEIASVAKAPALETIEEKFQPDWKALVDLKWRTSLAAAKAASAWLDLGFLAVDFRKFEEAREYFIKARDNPKTAASALNNLGNLSFIKGEVDAALSQYLQAQDRDGTDPQIKLNLARVYLKQGHPQKAQEAYEKAMSLNPSLRESYADVSVLAP